VLAAITVAGSTGRIGVETIVLTTTFAIGAAIPLLFFALAGRQVGSRVKAFRTHQRGIRMTGGIVMIALAVGLVFNLPQTLQKLIPDYTSALQDQFSNSEDIAQALDLGGIVTEENKDLAKCTDGASVLESCGTAPALSGLQAWFNTPGDEPLVLSDLAADGQVVLIDFWAYSCINCQRSIPHVNAWYDKYKDLGLTVIGVHAPEYAFEKEVRNVRAGAASFGIEYPVAIDNNLSTWTTYRNRYWPAHYLVDADGTVRHIKFGEGDYATTESLIRELLVAADPDVQLPPASDLADETPDAGRTTPETFLGSTKQVNFAGAEAYTAGTRAYALPGDQPNDTFALDGTWTLGTQAITPATAEAAVRLDYTGSRVEMVLSGEGRVVITDQDGTTRTIDVSGTPRSYPLVIDGPGSGVLTIAVSTGVEAYSLTFG
jgi:thiol-disulfide isomerase/thioredoxin